MKTIKKVRHFWNNRPCNIKHSNKKIGTKGYFKEVERKKYLIEPHILKFADFKRWDNKEVLEVGCGIGTDTINFAKNGAKVTVVEMSDVSLNLARQRAKVFNLTKQINFIQGNAENIKSYPKKKYDLIYSFGVIHHTPRPEKCLENFKKLLKLNGEVRIMVYHKRSWKVFCMIMKSGFQFWNTKKLIPKYSEAQTGCPVTFAYTKKEIKQIMLKLGFEIIDLNIEHIFSYKIKEYKKNTYIKKWYFRIMPKTIFKKLESLLGWHMCITVKRK